MRCRSLARSVNAALAALVLAALALAGSAHAGNVSVLRKPAPTQAYTMQWSAVFTDDLEYPPGSGVRHITDRTSSGTARLELVGNSSGIATFIGDGKGDMHRHDIVDFSGGLIQDLDASSTNGASTNPGELHINAINHTYAIGIPTLEGSGLYKLITPCGTTTQAVEHQTVIGPNKIDIPLPNGPVFSFSGVWDLPTDPNLCRTVHLDYTVSPVGPPPKLQLKQTPIAFLPTADGTVNGQVVQVGSGGSPVPIRFVLEEVTQEPGTCLNSADTNTAADIDFGLLDNIGVFQPPTPVGQTGWIIQTLLPATEATVKIRTRDYGAWGKLRAEAFYNNQWNPVPVEKSKLPYTTVPYDKDLDKIADQWEKDNKVKGAADSDLEKLPKGNGDIGDGFTLYEEYRGLMVKGQHTRLNPNVKKLVVENDIGGGADAGLALLKSASGFDVIILGQNELPAGRVANRNTSGLNHKGDQHGLLLRDVALSSGVLGEAQPAGTHNKRPKDCTQVAIDVTQALGTPGGAAELAATIAHECAHCIGVEHHGDPVPVTANRDVTELDTNVHVFATDGSEITARPFTVMGPMGAPGSEASGDTGCVMCYTNLYQWCVVTLPPKPPATKPTINFYAAPQPIIGDHFCASGKGTGTNAKGKLFGDAPRGNCLGQMRARDY